MYESQWWHDPIGDPDVMSDWAFALAHDAMFSAWDATTVRLAHGYSFQPTPEWALLRRRRCFRLGARLRELLDLNVSAWMQQLASLQV